VQDSLAVQVSSATSGTGEREVLAAYENYSQELFAYAATMVRNQDSALDAVQEAFLRYFLELTYGRRVDMPRAWLYRVLRNYLLDRIGAASVRREAGWEEAGEPVEQRPDPEAMMEQAQTARQITSLLTNRELDCLRLRSEDLSYGEIAGILGVRPGTVSALLARVHKKLLIPDQGKRTNRLRAAEALHFLFQNGGSYSS
jgi:RNA polymerase sigma factor (sigma-70 family)